MLLYLCRTGSVYHFNNDNNNNFHDDNKESKLFHENLSTMG